MELIMKFMINRVEHPLCKECDHYSECSSTCAAIEVLVKLAQQKTDHQVLDGVANVKTWLDLDNSFD